MKIRKHAFDVLESAIKLHRVDGRTRIINEVFEEYKAIITTPIWLRIWRFIVCRKDGYNTKL